MDDGLIRSLRLLMYFELWLQFAGSAPSSAKALILMGRHTQQKNMRIWSFSIIHLLTRFHNFNFSWNWTSLNQLLYCLWFHSHTTRNRQGWWYSSVVVMEIVCFKPLPMSYLTISSFVFHTVSVTFTINLFIIIYHPPGPHFLVEMDTLLSVFLSNFTPWQFEPHLW